MARTIAQIQAGIIAAKEADGTLAGLTSTSATAVWLLWAYITAVAIYAVEVLFDAHMAVVTALILAQKAHTLRWYVYMAKRYQHGYSLPADNDTYDVIDPSAQVVAQSAALEVSGLVRIKAAKDVAGVLGALDTAELLGLTAYMTRVRDAGVRIQVTSGSADDLQLVYKIYYDPLVLDGTGARLDGSAGTPISDAIDAYLKVLPFNGLLILNRLNTAVMAVEGVVNAVIEGAQARYGALAFADVTDEYTPDAGYILNDAGFFDANVVYVPHPFI